MKTSSFLRFALVFSTAALGSSAVLADEKAAAGGDGAEVTLQGRLNPGKSYVVRQVMESEMQLPLGDDAKALTTLEYLMKMAVGNAGSDGSKKVGVSMDGFKMKMDMGTTSMEYDSSDPDKQNPLLKGMMGSMTGAKFEAVFDKDDRLLESKEDGGPKPKAGAPGLMGVQMGEDQIREIMSNLVNHGFPDKAVKPGDAWTHMVESGMSQMGSFAMEMDYVYVGEAAFEGVKCLELKVTGRKAETEPKGEAAAPALVDIASADMTGRVMFDNAEGIARFSEMSMDMTMSSGGAELPVKSKVTSTLIEIGDSGDAE